MSNFTDEERNYFTICVKVFLPWKMHLPLESQLASEPQILLSVFRKFIVVMTTFYCIQYVSRKPS
jgi:hypothetical protein